MSLENKVAIVTGGAMGIGLGIAKALADKKCRVVVADINSEQCQKAVKELEAIGVQALAIKCDVSKKSDVVKLFEQTIKKFGQVDVLVNNAGIYPFVSLEKMTEKDWDKVIDVNLKSIFLTCKEALRLMPAGGRIVNISSIASLVGFEGLTHYCASKGAINGFTRAFALEAAHKNILVNVVAPGAIETPGASQGMSADLKKQTIATIPLARMGQPADIAGAVVFLATDDSAYITGQVIVVDGGWTLR